MNTKQNARRHQYWGRLGACLVVFALVLGMVGCEGGGKDPLDPWEEVEYTLTISSTDGGAVTEPGEGEHVYEAGTVVDLVAQKDTGYHFAGWTGDVDTVANVTAATTTIIMDDDYSIIATFAETPPGHFVLTVSSTTGGTVTDPGEGPFPRADGTMVDLVAVAHEHYRFVEWTGDIVEIDDPTSAETTITMLDDYEIMAVFEPVEYTLTVGSTPGGSVTDPGEDTFIYEYGTVVDLVAEADANHHFVEWTGDVGTVDNTEAAETTITVWGDYEITATFAINQYTLTYIAGTGGYIDGATPQTVEHGSDGTPVEAVAHEGYHFVEWSDSNTDNPRTDTNVTDHITVTAHFQFSTEPMVAAGGYHTVGLKSDGTVIAAGRNDDGQCDVGGWTEIVQVAAGYKHTVGLKADGTAVATGLNNDGQCGVGTWTDIVAIAAGGYHTVGLKDDGTVVGVGSNSAGQLDFAGWTEVHIIQVAAGLYHTVGLDSDGDVVAVGWNFPHGQCNVDGWTNILQVAAGGEHTVGLKSDGVATAGSNHEGQLNVGTWTDIDQLAAGGYHTVGLQSDGNVCATGRSIEGQLTVGGWDDIIQVAAGHMHTVGLKADGTVVATGLDGNGQCNVSGWNLN